MNKRGVLAIAHLLTYRDVKNAKNAAFIFKKFHFGDRCPMKLVPGTRFCIVNGTALLRNKVVRGSSVAVDGVKIARCGYGGAAGKGSVIDAKGCYVAPGFIDCHIHGDPKAIFAREARYGTTSIALAVSCCSAHELHKICAHVKRFMREDPLGMQLLGLHLEGPFISKEKAGAQDKRYIRAPDKKELQALIDSCGGLLKIMTIAPEERGALGLIRLLREKGIVASIGHTNAMFEEAKKAFRAGISHATHTYNAMRGLKENEPGAIGAVLADNDISAEIILDLLHVKALQAKAFFRSKPADKALLITDSVHAEYSEYSTVAHPRGVQRFVYRLKDGTIAGSALTMIEAVKNAVTKCGVPLVHAVRMATLNPAKLLGVDDKKGSLVPGKDADIVVFDDEFRVQMTFIGGKIAYQR